MSEMTIINAAINTTETPIETVPAIATPAESTWDKAEQVFEAEGLVAAIEIFNISEIRAATAFAYKHGGDNVRVRSRDGLTYLEFFMESGRGEDWTLWTETACLG
jgi:hypothetical protein